MKPKKCKICRGEFVPFRSLQMVCSPKCGIEYTKKLKEKDWKKRKKKIKESLKTWEDYYQEALKEFNAYIRERDRDKPCVSCGAPAGTYRLTSGHYFPQGSNKGIALDERNAHGQCWYNCNRNKSGNLSEYLPELKKRIGEEEFNKLSQKRNELIKPSIPELIELKVKFRDKTKQLKDANR